LGGPYASHFRQPTPDCAPRQWGCAKPSHPTAREQQRGTLETRFCGDDADEIDVAVIDAVRRG